MFLLIVVIYGRVLFSQQQQPSVFPTHLLASRLPSSLSSPACSPTSQCFVAGLNLTQPSQDACPLRERRSIANNYTVVSSKQNYPYKGKFCFMPSSHPPLLIVATCLRGGNGYLVLTSIRSHFRSDHCVNPSEVFPPASSCNLTEHITGPKSL